MCEILSQCNSSNYCIVHQKKRDENITDVVGKVNDIDDEVENKLFSNTPNDPLVFHESLSVLTLDNINDVESYYMDNIHTITMQFGVLLFLYSVIITKVCSKYMQLELDLNSKLKNDLYVLMWQYK